MSLKTIVTVIRGEKDGNRVLNAISEIVTSEQSHLIGIHAETSALAFMPAIGAEAVTYDEAILASNRQRMQQLRKWFLDRCEHDSVSTEWRGFENFMGDSAVSAVPVGFAADLIVVQQTDPDDPSDIADDLEALLFETGRPVLIIPYTSSSPLKFKRVVIAWKDSREAARAVFDALPILKKADDVEILVVDPADTPEHSGVLAAADIAAALSRHGVRVHIENQASGSIPVSAVIENRLGEVSADLLVMGAYSRSRWTERLFGGVTRTVLTSMTCATLLSR
jgi:nucleotide-binding universal stress UspA family protein